MADKAQAIALERFRQYLLLLARTRLRSESQAKIDASDVVQQALLQAHEHLNQYQGKSTGELAAWLRQILANSLSNALRALRTDKRDVQRERSLQEQLDQSSARLEELLAADQSSPSAHSHREERILQLAEALAQLTDSQREAIVLRYCEGWQLADIGAQLGCSAPVVVGLIQRGSRRLRELLEDTP